MPFHGVTRRARFSSQFVKRAGRVTPLRLVQLLAMVLAIAGVVRLAQWVETGIASRPAGDPYAPAIEAEGIQSIIVRDTQGRKAWEIAAAKIEVSADNATVTAINVKRGVLFRDGKPFLQLQAGRVSLNQQSRDLEATGHVSAQGPDGFSVQSERALWSNSAQRLECPGDVQATLRGLSFRTRGVFYEARNGELRCPGHVQMDSSRVAVDGSDVAARIKEQQVEIRGSSRIIIRRRGQPPVPPRAP